MHSGGNCRTGVRSEFTALSWAIFVYFCGDCQMGVLDHLALCATQTRVCDIVDYWSFICLHIFVHSLNLHHNDDRDRMANDEQQDHNNGHHHSTKNHRHEQLLTGWEQVPLQNGEMTATLPLGQTEQQDCDGMTRWLEMRGKQWGGKANKKMAQETLFDVSLAVGKCFFYSCVIIFLLTIFLGTS